MHACFLSWELDESTVGVEAGNVLPNRLMSSSAGTHISVHFIVVGSQGADPHPLPLREGRQIEII
jgi:hypothetical protein